MSDRSIEIEAEIEGTHAHLVTRGALDLHTAGDWLAAIDRALEAGARRIQLDLSGIARMDTAGAAALVEALRRVRAREGELIVAAWSEAARKRMAIVRALPLFAPSQPA